MKLSNRFSNHHEDHTNWSLNGIPLLTNPSDSVAPHYAVAVGIPSWHSLSALLASAALLCAAPCRRRRRIYDMPVFDSVKRGLGFVLRFMLRFSFDPSTMIVDAALTLLQTHLDVVVSGKNYSSVFQAQEIKGKMMKGWMLVGEVPWDGLKFKEAKASNKVILVNYLLPFKFWCSINNNMYSVSKRIQW
ncbi:hypothetical protein PIB30_077528 [Stylosanthes scabra]|uniref:Uncharacterized protein n=1 Tax=Stylosanthes scabra TaxID=79078 RepID=A0ABU6RQN4_9FABA|nr:hypothetical protein [Stylosanthes scabra]